jgi:hypothetical protein
MNLTFYAVDDIMLGKEALWCNFGVEIQFIRNLQKFSQNLSMSMVTDYLQIFFR